MHLNEATFANHKDARDLLPRLHDALESLSGRPRAGHYTVPRKLKPLARPFPGGESPRLLPNYAEIWNGCSIVFDPQERGASIWLSKGRSIPLSLKKWPHSFSSVSSAKRTSFAYGGAARSRESARAAAIGYILAALSLKTQIFVSAGEPSGVAIGAALMRTLKERIDGIRFAGLGGPAMADEGMRTIDDLSRTATMWLWGNLKRIPSHRRALIACVEEWKQNRPDLVITIDYQAFHLYLGTSARAMGIPVLHFVGSQFWGRRYYTLEPIRRAYNHVLLIHEFEKRYPLQSKLHPQEIHQFSVEIRLLPRV